MCMGVFVDIFPLNSVYVCITKSLFCGFIVCPTICESNLPSATAASSPDFPDYSCLFIFLYTLHIQLSPLLKTLSIFTTNFLIFIYKE